MTAAPGATLQATADNCGTRGGGDRCPIPTSIPHAQQQQPQQLPGTDMDIMRHGTIQTPTSGRQKGQTRSQDRHRNSQPRCIRKVTTMT